MERVYHGLSRHPLYRRWKRIKSRCYNSHVWDYKYYGGKGITMCDEWKNAFVPFYDYMMDLPNAMQLGMTIDRIRNKEGYKPGNVQWVSMHVQSAKREKRVNNTSGYTGLKRQNSQDRGWVAMIMVKGNDICLGGYKTPELAVTARNNYIIENGLTEYEIQKLF